MGFEFVLSFYLAEKGGSFIWAVELKSSVDEVVVDVKVPKADFRLSIRVDRHHHRHRPRRAHQRDAQWPHPPQQHSSTPPSPPPPFVRSPESLSPSPN